MSLLVNNMENSILQKRFFSKFQKGSINECWNWMGCKNKKGYGYLGICGKNIRAHRFSYELHKGAIPKGLLVCHTCDNPSCVNPKHLWLGTNFDNMRDMVLKKRTSKKHGEQHHRSKLTKQQVEEIRNLYNLHIYSLREISIKFNTAFQNIWFICKGKSWK